MKDLIARFVSQVVRSIIQNLFKRGARRAALPSRERSEKSPDPAKPLPRRAASKSARVARRTTRRRG